MVLHAWTLVIHFSRRTPIFCMGGSKYIYSILHGASYILYWGIPNILGVYNMSLHGDTIFRGIRWGQGAIYLTPFLLLG